MQTTTTTVYIKYLSIYIIITGAQTNHYLLLLLPGKEPDSVSEFICYSPAVKWNEHVMIGGINKVNVVFVVT